MNRYDRQLRLWGSAGQDLLSKAHICIIGPENSLLQETIKNLVLVGISKFTWFKSNDAPAYSQNDLFYKDLIQDMVPLNPRGVSIIQESMFNIHEITQNNNFSISIVISETNIPEELLRELSSSELSPVIMSHTEGLYGYVYTKLFEPHWVIESRPDYEVPSLRLDSPWDELREYMDTIRFETLDEYSMAELPYVVLLYKVLQHLHSSTQIDHKMIKDTLTNWYVSDINPKGTNDLNYDEALRYAHVALPNESYKVGLQKLIDFSQQDDNDRSNQWRDNYNRQIVTLVHALSIYLDSNCGDLMVNASIPDMESSSKIFGELQQVYRNKATRDLTEFSGVVHQLDESIPNDLITSFSCNVKNIKRIEPTARPINDFLTDSKLTEPYPILSTLLKFQKHQQVERTSDNKSFFLYESYPTTSFIGGLISQEVIKLITHQYIPISNTLIYDGMHNNITSFKC
ncbi:similar to Saccharomyces cerevisiae YPL003W ULA1 Protein that acts together with Uba3p to activate Rub1p before its conjugation to proteins (neddylation) [Maudiozyma barnettii]|uniref:Similar to Saccharomyces cerevisiae YPL003W ULA1 Protein that acts together with Uba3p to activate Rub1p before its conjugation to proteins (Neddylation) n=1 Tax=Maudiozyma barnettii TaxID=61262 RepID=A0A8H2VEI8_9SACH|nr:Ula1p [Kazachstania barnettii]CAB4254126.1 similar to Saccharomyces cerevisiae YPL003W ULA1 Protein that acts together with Uba3p to activate Rub1p before its conjugation to proteins (neddylation) [Kazachstania barnettii]CAD1781876.1 similar to Saccharomyces cerevisiae YPL003W ULA1 Protein that acts together with Uba3p to activate Rub1p before its conjugation to proteins (neddylation) [Kazachstania barnettii]